MQLATCMAVHEDLNRGGDLVEQLSSPNKIYLQWSELSKFAFLEHMGVASFITNVGVAAWRMGLNKFQSLVLQFWSSRFHLAVT